MKHVIHRQTCLNHQEKTIRHQISSGITTRHAISSHMIKYHHQMFDSYYICNMYVYYRVYFLYRVLTNLKQRNPKQGIAGFRSQTQTLPVLPIHKASGVAVAGVGGDQHLPATSSWKNRNIQVPCPNTRLLGRNVSAV